jgi:hypothetical protein
MAGDQLRYLLVAYSPKRDKNESATPLRHSKVGSINDVEPDTVSHAAQAPEQERESAVVTKSGNVFHDHGPRSHNLHEVGDPKYELVSRVFAMLPLLLAGLVAECREGLTRDARRQYVQALRCELQSGKQTSGIQICEVVRKYVNLRMIRRVCGARVRIGIDRGKDLHARCLVSSCYPPGSGA